MSVISFDNWNSTLSNSTTKTSTGGSGIGFLSLKDGDEAIVRIMHETPADFDVRGVHQVKIGKYFRSINCLREANQPVSACPLCETNEKYANKIYIRVLHYTKDERGNILVQPKIFERPVSFARDLIGVYNEYGALNSYICKITRTGSTMNDTQYKVLPANPNVYRNDLYPVNADYFKDYNVLGHCVMNKNYDELVAFIRDGDFPQKEAKQQQAPQTIQQPTYQRQQSVAPQQPVAFEVPPAQTMPWEQSVPQSQSHFVQTQPTVAQTNPPWTTAPQQQQEMQRPVRYYN